MKIKMQRDKDCKGSVRFSTADADAPITNVYVSRSLDGVNDAKEIEVEVTVPGAKKSK